MKRIIIVAMIVTMAGVVQAHDPNSLPANEQWQMTVNNNRIVTIDLRLPAKYVKILASLTKAEITTTIERMVKTWKSVCLKKWIANQNNRPDELRD